MAINGRALFPPFLWPLILKIPPFLWPLMAINGPLMVNYCRIKTKQQLTNNPKKANEMIS